MYSHYVYTHTCMWQFRPDIYYYISIAYLADLVFVN